MSLPTHDEIEVHLDSAMDAGYLRVIAKLIKQRLAELAAAK